MQSRIDVSAPFIAIRQDVKADRFSRTMGEYLCNPLSDDLLDVVVSTGGFSSDDELGVIASEEREKKPSFIVPAGKAVRFTLSTRDEYDDLMCHWMVRYRLAENDVTMNFGMSKRLGDTQFFADVPCLGGPAQVVPQSIYGR